MDSNPATLSTAPSVIYSLRRPVILSTPVFHDKYFEQHNRVFITNLCKVRTVMLQYFPS